MLLTISTEKLTVIDKNNEYYFKNCSKYLGRIFTYLNSIITEILELWKVG